jgi:hypothetical protein
MTARSRRVLPILIGCLSVLAWAAASPGATTTTTQQRAFEVISVEGNKVVYRTEEGVKEATLPDDFKLTMDGREIGLADLKPGMKGTATITTTTTSVPVAVTELVDAEVMAVAGNAIIVRMQDGFHKFTQEDMTERNVTILREGVKVDLSQLRVGDRLTARVITQKEPRIVTEQEVKAVVESAAPTPAVEAPTPVPAPVESAKPGGLGTLAWVLILLAILIVILLLVRRRPKP